MSVQACTRLRACICTALGAPVATLGSKNEKGVDVEATADGYIRMPVARFANTRRALLFCHRESNCSVYILRGRHGLSSPTPSPTTRYPYFVFPFPVISQKSFRRYFFKLDLLFGLFSFSSSFFFLIFFLRWSRSIVWKSTKVFFRSETIERYGGISIVCSLSCYSLFYFILFWENWEDDRLGVGERVSEASQ